MMGLASAAPGSVDEDLEWLRPLEDAMRSITAGFRTTSAEGSWDEEAEACASAEG
jgi:hypothetical protein